MKNIVICCDGTSNEPAANKTNVIKLFHTLVQESSAQVVYYHPGLGTMEAPSALTPFERYLTRLLGLAFGYGLKQDMRDAYVFLMNTFEPGDRIFLFGFSRGAYTVRAVASLVHAYGLIPPGNEPLVPYAVRNLIEAVPSNGTSDASKLAAEFKTTFGAARQCEIHFVGVWDTVSSIGWVDNQLWLRFSADNPSIVHGRHAVSIDERRAFFRSNLWRLNPALSEHGPRDVKQVWFPGGHGDVGGGWPEAESGLSGNALSWMLDEATAQGLLVDSVRREQVLAQSTSASRERHDALTWKWWPAEFVPKRHWNWAARKWERRLNLGRRRTIPPGSLIHASALDRLEVLPEGYVVIGEVETNLEASRPPAS